MISRRGLLMAFLALGVTSKSAATPRGVHIRGTLDPTEQEAQEAYFPIGKELMIATTPNSPIYDDLLMMRGLEVQVSIFVP